MPESRYYGQEAQSGRKDTSPEAQESQGRNGGRRSHWAGSLPLLFLCTHHHHHPPTHIYMPAAPRAADLILERGATTVSDNQNLPKKQRMVMAKVTLTDSKKHLSFSLCWALVENIGNTV